jgi:hypothetical protein
MIRPPASTAAAALWYAERGWPIFPLFGKDPAIRGGHGFYDATSDPSTIAAWWRRFPRANIGWALRIGEAPHVVLDDDGGAAEELAATDRPLPATLTQVSRPGRRHYVYVMPPGVAPTGQPDPDLSHSSAQTRVAGFGYIVVEPSRHPYGSTYAWESSLDLIAEAPEWLVEHVCRPPIQPVAVEDTGRELDADDLAFVVAVGDLDPRVKALYRGEWEGVVRGRRDQSRSAADALLVALLHGYGADPQRIARIMQGSRMSRGKYGDRRGTGDTYLTRTIGRVVAHVEAREGAKCRA